MIGLSILSGAHLHLCSKLFSVFQEKNALPPPVFLGGIIPEEDIAELKEMGIREIFQPGASLESIGTAVERIAGTR